jgi:hypothetical protein
MKKQFTRFGDLRLYIALGLLLSAAGCADRSGEGRPPTQVQLQQQNSTIMNDPHVPDSVKQHLTEQQTANQAAAKGYSADLQQKRAGNK